MPCNCISVNLDPFIFFLFFRIQYKTVNYLFLVDVVHWTKILTNYNSTATVRKCIETIHIDIHVDNNYLNSRGCQTLAEKENTRYRKIYMYTVYQSHCASLHLCYQGRKKNVKLSFKIQRYQILVLEPF